MTLSASRLSVESETYPLVGKRSSSMLASEAQKQAEHIWSASDLAVRTRDGVSVKFC